MPSWLMHSPPDQVVQVCVLPGLIVLCSWQDTLLSQCLSPPRCINGSGTFSAGGNPVMD